MIFTNGNQLATGLIDDQIGVTTFGVGSDGNRNSLISTVINALIGIVAEVNAPRAQRIGAAAVFVGAGTNVKIRWRQFGEFTAG